MFVQREDRCPDFEEVVVPLNVSDLELKVCRRSPECSFVRQGYKSAFSYGSRVGRHCLGVKDE